MNLASEDSYPSIPIKSLEHGVRSYTSVLMGHFLIVQIHDRSDSPPSQDLCLNSSSTPNGSEPTTLWAVDLQNNTVDAAIHMKEFYFHEEYTFLKYGENQIIKFGGRNGHGEKISAIHQITIESFKRIDFCIISSLMSYKAFKIKCEEIRINGNEQLAIHRHTAQIYEDALYVYGGRTSGWRPEMKRDLRRFDFKSSTWKLCKTTGDDPGPREYASSFLIDNNMYIYGGEGDSSRDLKKNDIFVLNLESLTWTRLQQSNPLNGININGGLYKRKLLFLKRETSFFYKIDVGCWNIDTNSWSTFSIPKPGLSDSKGNLIVYLGILLATGTTDKNGKELSLTLFDLNKLELPMSPEQKHLKSFFMNKEESDIMFKVQDNLIPAHKNILIQKSKYFAGLFNSGMIESRQEVIEINDCEFPIFQEFLRFIYYDHVQGLDVHLAFKMISLADKYLLGDNLNERCMDVLAFHINSKNINTIFDLARKDKIYQIQNRLIELIKTNINFDNVSELMRYLGENPISDNIELSEKAFEIVSTNYTKIFKKQKENLKFYAEFLIRCLGLTTIEQLSKLIHHPDFKKLKFNFDEERKDSGSLEEAQGAFEYATTNLRKHVFDFARANFEILKEEEILRKLDLDFLIDLLSYETEERKKCENIIKTLQKSAHEIQITAEDDTSQEDTHKRTELSHHDISNENPFLKQTKKDSDVKQ